MHVLVSGTTGLIGSALVPALERPGHRVSRLVRTRGAQAGGEIPWDPETDKVGEPTLDTGGCVDAVVHLAGENIAARRWSPRQRERIRQSRVRGTRLLAEATARLARPPRVFVSASAVGIYGERGDEVLRETSALGDDFLAEVCQEWEAATAAAERVGVRVVRLRLGVVLSARGGALTPMLPPFRWGLGGVLGGGRQWMSWVDLEDVVDTILHALSSESLCGAVNVVAPNPVTNRAFVKTLGAVLGRPTLLPVPAVVLRLLLGDMAQALLLSSQRAVPARLQEAGYRFRYPELAGALRHALGRS